jgi:N-acetylmuramoyl-L-alanine amidase CwlA
MRKVLSKEEWLRKKRMKNYFMLGSSLALLLVIIILIISLLAKLFTGAGTNTSEKPAIDETLSNGKVIQQMLLTPNEYSRAGEQLNKVKGIVIHYTANPGTSAEANRNYFESLAEKKTTYASSHYVIGLEGEVVQCVPLNEIAYASNERNKDTISIECCHSDITGKFNDTTYESLIALVAALCNEYNIKEKNIIRHYDVTGKMCPLYYVEHEDEWEKLKDDVMEKVKELKQQESES